MVKKDCLKDGLKINVKTTKTIVIRRDISDGSKVNITVDGRTLGGGELCILRAVNNNTRWKIEIARREFLYTL
jgi:hypothetical protein